MNSYEIDDVDLMPSIDGDTKSCISLWAAVFNNGINETISDIKNNRNNYWFNNELEHIGSFIWLCELFNIAPHQARDKIRKSTNTSPEIVKSNKPFEPTEEITTVW